MCVCVCESVYEYVCVCVCESVYECVCVLCECVCVCISVLLFVQDLYFLQSRGYRIPV